MLLEIKINKLLLVLLAGLAIACTKAKNEMDNKEKTGIPLVIGTYTQKEGHVDGKAEGVYLYELDTSSGKLTYVNVADGVINPSYVATFKPKNLVIAASETAPGEVYTYHYDSSSQTLLETGAVASEGDQPCHVSIHPSGDYAFVANYGSGSLTAYKINEEGKLSEFWTVKHTGKSKTPRQKSAHAHMAWFDPENPNQLFAVDLGLDKIKVYNISDSTLTKAYDIKFPAGSGPRQIAFHPNGNGRAYTINELNGTISLLQKNSTGIFEHIKSFNALKSSQGAIDAGAADIQITPSGKYLYASIRGKENNIAMFSIDSNSGELTLLGYQTSGGDTPRAIKIDPTGRYLLVPNQNTSNIITYGINADGTLKDLGIETEIPTPVSIAFIE